MTLIAQSNEVYRDGGKTWQQEQKEAFINSIPRRARLDLLTPAELAIVNAMQEIEMAGASVKLTNAVILLQQARDLVADHVEGIV